MSFKRFTIIYMRINQYRRISTLTSYIFTSIELGLMSTTKDLKIAVDYSQSLEGNALLLKFKISNLKQFGADVSWLSAFPTEEEILYPPLTFLQPTGRVETTTIKGMAFTTVEIEPHV